MPRPYSQNFTCALALHWQVCSYDSTLRRCDHMTRFAGGRRSSAQKPVNEGEFSTPQFIARSPY